MFFSQVHHLIVAGKLQKNDDDTLMSRCVWDIQGVIDYTLIMRYLCKQLQINDTLHSWLVSDRGEESLFKKPLQQLHIGLEGADKIKQCQLDDTIQAAIRVMNKNMMTSLPIQYSDKCRKLVGILEPEDVRYILTKSKFIKSPGTLVRHLFNEVMHMYNSDQDKYGNYYDCKEQDEDQYDNDS